MTTLASAALDLARIVTSVREGVATGGNATTLADTARSEPDDYFHNGAHHGTIWFLSGNNSGKSAIITNWVQTTGTFTFVTPGAACAAADRYAAVAHDWPRDVLWQAVNAALRTIGAELDVDVTAVTVADQEEYTLPTGVTDIRKVEIAQETTAPYDYAVNYHWQQVDGKLRFDTDYAPATAGLKIRITHQPAVTELTSDTGAIGSGIHPDLLKWTAAVHLLRWALQRKPDNGSLAQMLNEAVTQADKYTRLYGLRPVSRVRHATW